jgi:hypothetical protein
MSENRQIQMIRTPQGPLALVRQTAEKLLAGGVLSGTLDGDLHAADAATVKAAIMASAVCDFCSSPGASHYYDVPDFSIGKLPGNCGAGASTGGWMACDTCDELIKANRRQQLIDRAVQNMAFPKFTRNAIGELYAKFWEGMDERSTAEGIAQGITEFVEDKLPPHAQVILTDRDKRVEAMVRVIGLTHAQVQAATEGKLDRDAVAKLVRWRKGFGGPVDAAALADLLAGTGPKKPLPDVTPHWQKALDAKFDALRNVTNGLARQSRAVAFKDAVDLKDPAAVARVVRQAQARNELEELGFDEDVKYLRAADAYSFNGETIGAIREAARGIPRDAPLSSIETPNTGAGWFWFAEPLPITASPIVTDKVHALLWGWTNRTAKSYRLNISDEMYAKLDPEHGGRLRELAAMAETQGGSLPQGYAREVSRMLSSIGVTQNNLDRYITKSVVQEPAIMFSAYVVDEHGKVAQPGGVAPSTRWFWPMEMSLAEMLDYNGGMWEKDYGADAPNGQLPHLVGKAETLHCVEQLSLFFVMACLWFRQTVPVLTREPGHVERHAKKRYVREHKLSDVPTVQVVALRKSLRVAAEKAEGAQAAGAREYHCRWIVKGHPRLQACGPGRKDRKMIWIDAHPAGPDDKPLRTREKVYAVIR